MFTAKKLRCTEQLREEGLQPYTHKIVHSLITAAHLSSTIVNGQTCKWPVPVHEAQMLEHEELSESQPQSA